MIRCDCKYQMARWHERIVFGEWIREEYWNLRRRIVESMGMQ